MSNYIKVLPTQSEGWQRPTEWLSIPSYTVNEEVIYLLNAVWDTTVNPCAFSAGGTGSGVTVDWGDGTITNYAFGVAIERNFNYNSLSGTPFRGYRQALVKITPRAGATINALYLATRHSSYPYAYHTGWLECHLNFTVTNDIPFMWNNPVWHSNVENIFIKAYTPTRMDYMFLNMTALQKVNAFNTSAVTLAQSCYSGCSSLKEDPNFDFSNVTNASSMYAGTTNLIKIKPTDFRKVTDAGNMFAGTGIKDISTLQFRDIVNMNLFSYTSVGITHWCDFSNCNNIVGNIDYSLYCSGTDIFPNIKLGSITTMTNLMYAVGPRTLRKVLATGARYSHSIANQLLDATALNEYFTGLGTAVGAASLTITGNPGTGTCNQSIATTKGWTVIN